MNHLEYYLRAAPISLASSVPSRRDGFPERRRERAIRTLERSLKI